MSKYNFDNSEMQLIHQVNTRYEKERKNSKD